jgi:hypothetical protein
MVSWVVEGEVMADENEEQKKPLMGTMSKATVIGASTGAGGAVVITWASSEIERRWAIPKEVGAFVLGSAFAFVARWAAKLLPPD